MMDTLDNYESFVDTYESFDATALYPSDTDLMAINIGPLHPVVVHSPFRYITILPPDHRVDLYERYPPLNGFELSMPQASPPKPLSAIFASRIQFAVDVLKDIPKMMVTETQTPWCHRQLYKNNMPKEMQDAFTCCSLYMTKNEINAPVLMSIFDSRINDLLSSPPPTEPLQLLARIHALILHLIMRLFDGNIRSQPSSQCLFDVLETSVQSLLGYIYLPHPSETLELLPIAMDPVMNFWNTWIFQESARRTVMMVFYFVSIHNYLQGRPAPVCDGKLGLELAWYQSAHLWYAQSAFDFAVAWTENLHFIVYNADFSGLLQDAKPDDVDLFGRMLLVTKIGIDETKAWFYSRGGSL
ncbi:hypothetical protein N7491_000176 [Penicillium cf. griseofulvum]|uniref:Transcription factor domain-containing protein n=1 Tax=Penicillium cf. griseofulvum TaxID=2972120 RepID=A0A9W9MFU6_9EURO|nr:hypothetical protein N7472_004471 [Penicillium cf. griseofulvum]KAJ5450994.1 hypothetical protein N7491_000176 [Penicillium cf. griseofulvum]